MCARQGWMYLSCLFLWFFICLWIQSFVFSTFFKCSLHPTLLCWIPLGNPPPLPEGSVKPMKYFLCHRSPVKIPHVVQIQCWRLQGWKEEGQRRFSLLSTFMLKSHHVGSVLGWVSVPVIGKWLVWITQSLTLQLHVHWTLGQGP